MNRDHIVRLMEAAREAGRTASAEDDFDPNGAADDGNPFGMPEAELTHAVDVSAYCPPERESLRAHRSQVTDTSFFLEMPDEVFDQRSAPSGSSSNGAEPGLATRMVVRVTRLYLVRHGRASAGWDTDPDPGLDEIGVRQANGGSRPARVTRPAADRHQPAAALPARPPPNWHDCGRSNRTVEPAVAEIPSPRGRGDGRSDRLVASRDARHVDRSRPAYVAYRDTVVSTLVALADDSVVFSHFVAINAAIGVGDRRRSAGHAQPRQLLGHRRRRRRRRVTAC